MTGYAHEVHLPRRERQVLLLLVEGLSTKEIALQLDIAPKTVEGHIERMRLRLGASNRCHLVGLAAGMGLIVIDGQPREISDEGAGEVQLLHSDQNGTMRSPHARFVVLPPDDA